MFDESEPEQSSKLPQHRLVVMLQQAVAYQMEFSHYQPPNGKAQV